jgi:hypothetical protein
MSETNRLLKVFLSYASHDKPIVQELSLRLASERWIDPWVDEKKLLPGQDWRAKIEEAVETSDIVIICLSCNSISKEGFVQKELRYAREIALEKPEETIFIIPLRLDECNVPRGLRFYQWADYFGEKKDEAYSALVESLKFRYQQKLKVEERERAHHEKGKQEHEAAGKIAKEKAGRQAVEKTVREKVEHEATENKNSLYKAEIKRGDENSPPHRQSFVKRQRNESNSKISDAESYEKNISNRIHELNDEWRRERDGFLELLLEEVAAKGFFYILVIGIVVFIASFLIFDIHDSVWYCSNVGVTITVSFFILRHIYLDKTKNSREAMTRISAEIEKVREVLQSLKEKG